MEKVTAYKSLNGHLYETEEECKAKDKYWYYEKLIKGPHGYVFLYKKRDLVHIETLTEENIKYAKELFKKITDKWIGKTICFSCTNDRYTLRSDLKEVCEYAIEDCKNAIRLYTHEYKKKIKDAEELLKMMEEGKL